MLATGEKFRDRLRRKFREILTESAQSGLPSGQPRQCGRPVPRWNARRKTNYRLRSRRKKLVSGA